MVEGWCARNERIQKEKSNRSYNGSRKNETEMKSAKLEREKFSGGTNEIKKMLVKGRKREQKEEGDERNVVDGVCASTKKS